MLLFFAVHIDLSPERSEGFSDLTYRTVSGLCGRSPEGAFKLDQPSGFFILRVVTFDAPDQAFDSGETERLRIYGYSRQKWLSCFLGPDNVPNRVRGVLSKLG